MSRRWTLDPTAPGLSAHPYIPDPTFWVCDHCFFLFASPWEPAHVRTAPFPDCDLWVHWRRAYLVPAQRSRWLRRNFCALNTLHYCSDECVEPHDAEAVRLALLDNDADLVVRVE